MTRLPGHILILLLLWATVAHADYSATRDIGLVPDSYEAAEINWQIWQAALDAQWPGGKFQFADGHIGPVDEDIAFAGGDFIISRTVSTIPRTGGGMHGVGGQVGNFNANSYSNTGNNARGGNVTRITCLDPNVPPLRIRSGGYRVSGFQFNVIGRLATKPAVAIEVEARQEPVGAPTTYTKIEDCTFVNYKTAIRLLAGYYDETGVFKPLENMADQGTARNLAFWDCDTCFQSLNQQAVGWHGYDWRVNGLKSRVLDFERGGNFTLDGLTLNLYQWEILVVRDYSQNNSQFSISHVKGDLTDDANPHALTWFKYEGPPRTDAHWAVSFRDCHTPRDPKTYDASKLVVVPAGFPTAGITFDACEGLPTAGMKVSQGKWTPNVGAK